LTPHSPALANFVRRAIVVVGVASVSVAVYFLVTLAQVWSTGRDDSFAASSRTVDAIVVLGAAQYDGRPSPQLQARLDHALLLWKREAAAFIVVTGGKQANDRFTEAQAGREYLIANGVPAAVILVEPNGASTFESLAGVRRDLVATIGHVVLVSDPYHVLRARLVADELGFVVDVSATRSGVTQGTAALRRNAREALGIMVGRITGFRQLEAWLQ
jgi:uncharacterized SAM-binding protein YcdF (DUF218 family)